MPARSHFLALGAALAVSAPTHAEKSAADCRVLVMNLVGQNLAAADHDIPALLTETLAREAAQVSGCAVVSQADVRSMFDFEAQRSACGEGGDSCLSEIGAALGADRLISGSLGRLGGDIVVTARLLNVRSGSVEARAEQVVHGAVEQLRDAARNAARDLFGAPHVASSSSSSPTSSPTSSSTSSPTSPTSSSLLLVAGVATAVVGAVGGVGGLLAAGVAEAQLGDGGATDKDAIVGTGRIALGVAIAGGVVGVVGAGIALAAAPRE
jgi:TolB-like protein